MAMQNSIELMEEDGSAQLCGLKQKAEALTDNNLILRRLYFDDMYKRADSITDATHGTFDWLLPGQDTSSEQMSDDDETYDEETYDEDTGDEDTDDEEAAESRGNERERHERQESAAKISEFLEYGNGVFFLRGKPGSGKSTLMKYLIEGRGKQEVHRKLQRWAGQKCLIRVSAMFLLHGAPLQRSLEGFYRTLLFEILCQCPEPEHELFPKASELELPGDSYASSLRLETLKEAWQILVSIKDHDKIKICVSIDGLDEMERNSGDRLKFSRILKQWAESEDIKIICSGRPNAEFNAVYDQPRQRIDLQDLTRSDIRKILEDRFDEVRHVSDISKEKIEELVNIICYHSEGVILWAVLVGKCLEDDMIHRKSFDGMKCMIRELPYGVEDLFNDMFQGLPHNARQQSLLRTIYRLLEVNDRPIRALPLSWLEDALSDSDFPYDRPIKALDPVELDFRLEIVRAQLIQHTKHFVEIFNPVRNDDELYFHAECRFIHRSAQEFIQSKLGPFGSAPGELDSDIVDLYLRLKLMFEMSLERKIPTNGLAVFFWHTRKHQKYLNSRYPQLQPRLLDKLHELLEVRHGIHDGDRATSRIAEVNWVEVHLDCFRGMTQYFLGDISKGPVSIFHLALGAHQVDYITRILEDKSQEIDQQDLDLGLLICATGIDPSHGLFNLLVDHRADPDCLIDVYFTESQSTPELIPLWLLLCFWLAFDTCRQYDGPNSAYINMRLHHEFLILERLLQLGYGLNVKFLAVSGIDSQPEDPSQLQDPSVFKTDERALLGVELAQIVRFSKPGNMDRLLLLIEPPSSTFLSLAERLTNFVLQPQFPFQNLPHDAITMPYRRVSDGYLSRERWTVWGVFSGEYEINKSVKYYLPWPSDG